ncbi:MAG: alpha-E domain-containing protein [Acidimicrobiales bacterium]|nr:alpha-E domain-containing protein [Acidimicrobiales bacterium]MCB1259855.1 alpha-E domain-containing protein [Acidimicrobiales bacterium]
MTLLSSAAESLYWTGRYLERAEGTARILATHTALFMDLPRSAGLTWAPLLAITGTSDQFDELYPAPDEDHVVEFLATDGANSGSVVRSLEQARFNARVTRAIVPRDAYEIINDVHRDAAERAFEAVPRRSRLAWLSYVIDRCRAFIGVIDGSMPRDPAWSFLRLGRHLERADLTSRVLDVRAGALIEAEGAGPGGPSGELDPEELQAFADLQWIEVLRSVEAHQAYRRKVHSAVGGREVLAFLLQDRLLPRSVLHCMEQVSSSLAPLRHPDELVERCTQIQRYVAHARLEVLERDGLREWVDDLQVLLGQLHDEIGAAYFHAPVVAPTAHDDA